MHNCIINSLQGKQSDVRCLRVRLLQWSLQSISKLFHCHYFALCSEETNQWESQTQILYSRLQSPEYSQSRVLQLNFQWRHREHSLFHHEHLQVAVWCCEGYWLLEGAHRWFDRVSAQWELILPWEQGHLHERGHQAFPIAHPCQEVKDFHATASWDVQSSFEERDSTWKLGVRGHHLIRWWGTHTRPSNPKVQSRGRWRDEASKVSNFNDCVCPVKIQSDWVSANWFE